MPSYDQDNASSMIRYLAGLELRCQHQRLNAQDIVVTCPDCEGTERIVPFKVLRVPCVCIGQGVMLRSPIMRQDGTLEMEEYPCPHCNVLPSVKENTERWFPEPNVKVACWEILRSYGLVPSKSDTEEEYLAVACAFTDIEQQKAVKL